MEKVKDENFAVEVIVVNLGDLTSCKPDLSPKVIKTVARVRRKLGEKRFQICASPPVCGGKEILSVVSEGEFCRTVNELAPLSRKAWDLLLERVPELAGADVQTIYEDNSGGPLLVAESERLFSYIKEIAKLLRCGEKAFLASTPRVYLVKWNRLNGFF